MWNRLLESHLANDSLVTQKIQTDAIWDPSLIVMPNGSLKYPTVWPHSFFSG